ncbi:salicylate synthase [Amycolatopsis sp. NPDC088138]|uniref:salicylate synthase n=1 Tax=Amycolatopsis sp. NPDC088138 TaxID=3363938 RepID=UPI00380B77AD
MTRLAAAVEPADYVVYEKPPMWTFAAGSIAEIIVTRCHSVLLDSSGEHIVARDPRPLGEIPALLDRVNVSDWCAYGIAAFDLCHGDAQGNAAADDAILMHLIIPSVEVRLIDGWATVRGVSQDEVRRLTDIARIPVPPPRHQGTPIDVTREDGTDYRKAVADVIDEIHARELHKVVLSRSVTIDGDVDVPATFLLGRRHNNPARSFMTNLDGVRAAGYSPEIIAEVSPDGLVLTQPLAGTRAFVAGDTTQNDRLQAELLQDSKEVFEHAVAVRNSCHDMAAVCTPESIAVQDFMTVQRRGSLQHLGSIVKGTLALEQGPWDAFIALLPTLIGRPRPEAYALIQEYETTPRGLYGGAVLAIDSHGGLDAALVIRALFQEGGRTWLRAGAGIVPESSPGREFEETCEKLRSVSPHIVVTATVSESGSSGNPGQHET